MAFLVQDTELVMGQGKCLDNVGMALLSGHLQGSGAMVVLHVDIGAGPDQCHGSGGMTLFSGKMQGGSAIVGLRVQPRPN